MSTFTGYDDIRDTYDWYGHEKEDEAEGEEISGGEDDLEEPTNYNGYGERVSGNAEDKSAYRTPRGLTGDWKHGIAYRMGADTYHSTRESIQEGYDNWVSKPIPSAILRPSTPTAVTAYTDSISTSNSMGVTMGDNGRFHLERGGVRGSGGSRNKVGFYIN